MSKSWYEIDRREAGGELDGYDMVKGGNLKEELKRYLGTDYKDYVKRHKRVNGRVVVTATCPRKTSGYLEIARVSQ